MTSRICAASSRLTAGASSRAAGCRACLFCENPVDQLGDAEREDGVHVVPQPPVLQRAVGPAPAAGEAVAETVQEGVEIGVLDDQHLVFGMLGVVVGQMAGQLQPQRRLARALFTENDGRGRLAGIAVDFVPGGMERVADADPFEDEVGLGVLIGERIGDDAVMIEELLDFH